MPETVLASVVIVAVLVVTAPLGAWAVTVLLDWWDRRH